jgi:hypothetical protein
MYGGTSEMRRREFFSFASGVVVVPRQLVKDTGEPGIAELTEKLCLAIKGEIPGVTKIEVTYDPEDKKVPLMILAFRA